MRGCSWYPEGCSRPSTAEKVLPGEVFGVQQRNTRKVPVLGDTNHTLCSGHLGLWSVVLLPACGSQQQVEAEPGVWPRDLLWFLSTSPWLAASTPGSGHKKDIPQPWCGSVQLCSGASLPHHKGFLVPTSQLHHQEETPGLR